MNREVWRALKTDRGARIRAARVALVLLVGLVGVGLVLGALAGVVWFALRVGVVNFVFWFYVGVTLIRIALSPFVVAAQANVLADPIADLRAGRHLAFVRKLLAAVLVMLAIQCLWPMGWITWFRARRMRPRQHLQRGHSIELQAALARLMIIPLDAMLFAFSIALVITVFQLPAHIELRIATILAACCTGLLAAYVLNPGGLPADIRASTPRVTRYLIAIGALVYLTLLLSFIRLDPHAQHSDFRPQVTATAVKLSVPGREWFVPWAARSTDQLTGGSFELSKQVEDAPFFQPRWLDFALLLAGVLFYMTIVASFATREKLERSDREVLSHAGALLTLHRFKEALITLDELKAPNRTFESLIIRAVTELCLGNQAKALELAQKAANVYATYGEPRDPEPLLYLTAAQDLDLPESVFVPAFKQWLTSDRCKDETLWLVTIAVTFHRVEQLYTAVAEHVTVERFPLTQAYLLLLQQKPAEARAMLASIAPVGPQAAAAHLYTSYVADSKQTETFELQAWLESHFDALEAHCGALRGEDFIRAVLPFVHKLQTESDKQGLQWGPKLAAIQRALARQYADAPGLMDASMIFGMLEARSLRERLAKSSSLVAMMARTLPKTERPA